MLLVLYINDFFHVGFYSVKCVTTQPLAVRENRKSFQRKRILKHKEMNEKNVILEWTPAEAAGTLDLSCYIFTDRKEVRQ